VNGYVAHDVSHPEQAHLLRVRYDRRGLIAWCACNCWGYFGGDEDRAYELHGLHVEEAEADDGG
jgi:hypothetical protein